MPRAKSAMEKVLEAWKTLQPAEKAAVLAVIKMEVEPRAKSKKKETKAPVQPLTAV